MFEKSGVKIVYESLVHRGSQEGPCRTGDKNYLSTENERKQKKADFKNRVEDAKKNLGEDAEILEPVYIEHAEDFVVKERELNNRSFPNDAQ